MNLIYKKQRAPRMPAFEERTESNDNAGIDAIRVLFDLRCPKILAIENIEDGSTGMEILLTNRRYEMIRNSLKHFVRPMVMLFVLGLVTAGAFTAHADTEYSAKIKEAMAVMKNDAAKLGESKVDGSSLVFGTTKMNGNYELVDSLKAKFGCTATLFVKKGDAFIRISTNVLKDGNRAVGTPLDPNGAAIVAIRKGEAYYGVVDILGSQYDTGYEPIKSASGEITGIYYIGYPMGK